MYIQDGNTCTITQIIKKKNLDDFKQKMWTQYLDSMKGRVVKSL